VSAILTLGAPCKGFVGQERCGSTVYENIGRPDSCACVLFDGPAHRHLRCASCHQRVTLELMHEPSLKFHPVKEEVPCPAQ
jgi:hypothetical protein